MQIAESWKNYLPGKVKITFAGYRPHALNQPSRCINLYSAFKLAVMIGNSSLDAQQRSLRLPSSIEVMHCRVHCPLFKTVLLSPGTGFFEPVAHRLSASLIDHSALKRKLQHRLKTCRSMKPYASFLELFRCVWKVIADDSQAISD